MCACPTFKPPAAQLTPSTGPLPSPPRALPRWLNIGLFAGLAAGALATAAAALPAGRGAPLALQLVAASFVAWRYAASLSGGDEAAAAAP